MQKLMTFAVVAGLSLAANFAQAGLFGLRVRPVSRTEVENSDPSAAVLRVSQAYGTRVAAEPQPTPADLPPMPSPAPLAAPPVVAVPAAAPENVAVPVQTLHVAPAVYQNVRVRQGWKAHPCAVPMLVAVTDPCNPCCQVCVEICVPPCQVADIRCTRRGTGVVYDFGKYEVEIKQRGELLVVDYDR
jgi:hypothetical protein